MALALCSSPHPTMTVNPTIPMQKDVPFFMVAPLVWSRRSSRPIRLHSTAPESNKNLPTMITSIRSYPFVATRPDRTMTILIQSSMLQPRKARALHSSPTKKKKKTLKKFYLTSLPLSQPLTLPPPLLKPDVLRSLQRTNPKTHHRPRRPPPRSMTTARCQPVRCALNPKNQCTLTFLNRPP